MLSGLKHTPSLIIAPVSPSSSPLLPSANTSQGEQFQVLQNTWRCRGRGGWIKSKRHATKSVHATSSGHKRASESSGGQRLRVFLAQGDTSFFLQGSAALPLTPTVMCDLEFPPSFAKPQSLFVRTHSYCVYS